MLEEIGLPTRLLQPLVEPGTIIGPLQPSASDDRRRHTGRRAGVPRHRIGGRVGVGVGARSRFSAPAPGRCSAPRCDEPVITARALALNFTNEGGVVRHDAPVEEHRRAVAAAVLPSHWRVTRGRIFRMRRWSPAPPTSGWRFRSLIDPDYPPFLNPTDMPATIARVLPA